MDLGNFEFGDPKLNHAGARCCGKPVGCTMKDKGCAYLRHPWKRAYVFGDAQARAELERPAPDAESER